jgi:DnaJ-class molecular chaperone
MTSEIKKFIESQGLLICPTCGGEGTYETFYGHYSSETCSSCQGKGIIRSLNKQKHRKECVICNGRGCLGGCNHRGYHEWESFELY